MTPENMMTLVKLRACHGGLSFLLQVPDPEIAWNTCQRGDWVAWFLKTVLGCYDCQDSSKIELAAYQAADDQATIDERDDFWFLTNPVYLKYLSDSANEIRAEYPWERVVKLIENLGGPL